MISIDAIMRQVAEQHGETVYALRRKTKLRRIYMIRRQIAGIARREGHALVDIGAALGGLAPSTISRMVKGYES
jgi:chromosomal replication initiation ATPase DnaA